VVAAPLEEEEYYKACSHARILTEDDGRYFRELRRRWASRCWLCPYGGCGEQVCPPDRVLANVPIDTTANSTCVGLTMNFGVDTPRIRPVATRGILQLHSVRQLSYIFRSGFPHRTKCCPFIEVHSEDAVSFINRLILRANVDVHDMPKVPANIILQRVK
jgi:hypothetical protein